MRKHFCCAWGLALLLATLNCSKKIDDGGSGDVDFSNAKRVVSSNFYAARSGDSDHLASLCDSSGTANQHVLRICGQSKGAPDWTEFARQFQKGTLSRTHHSEDPR